MEVITYKHVTEDPTRPYRYIAESATLRFPPGRWPRLLPTTMGNGQFFYLMDTSRVDGDLLCARYRQANGIITLVVFND